MISVLVVLFVGHMMQDSGRDQLGGEGEEDAGEEENN